MEYLSGQNVKCLVLEHNTFNNLNNLLKTVLRFIIKNTLSENTENYFWYLTKSEY